jgi:hypothetical protein
MPDSTGHSYALVSETNVGDWLTAGPGMLSIPEGTTLQVYMTIGPSPRFVVMGPMGEHDLAGQLDPDGTYHGGLSADRTEYLYFYPGEAPDQGDWRTEGRTEAPIQTDETGGPSGQNRPDPTTSP